MGHVIADLLASDYLQTLVMPVSLPS